MYRADVSRKMLLQPGPVRTVRAGEGALPGVHAVVLAEVVLLVELFAAHGASVVGAGKLGRQVLKGYDEKTVCLVGN